MKNSGRRDSFADGRIDWRIKVIVIPALVMFAFLLGLFALGPWWRSRSGHGPNIAQTLIPASPRTHIVPKSQNQPAPKLDLEITETQPNPNQTSADANGVEKDANGITVTMNPGDGQPQAAADNSNSNTDANPVIPGDDKSQAENQTNQAENQTSQVAQPATPSVPSPDSSGAPIEKSRAAVSSPSVKGLYRVQAGTYSNKASADRLASDLRDHGYRAEVKSVQSATSTLYRVQVGEYKSQINADAVAARLKSDGYSPKVIVVNVK